MIIVRKYRCYHDIIYDVLRILASEGPMNITRLCTSVKIPVDRGLKLMSVLEKAGLVIIQLAEKSKLYAITSRGYQYMAIYEELTKILDPFIHTHKL